MGGGIAGTVVAIALRKAGLEPVIVEAFDRAAEGVGAFLTVAPNGVRGLRALGIDDQVMAPGFDTPRFEISLGDGSVLAEMSAGAGEDGATRTIRRSDLYGGLRREAEALLLFAVAVLAGSVPTRRATRVRFARRPFFFAIRLHEQRIRRN